MYTLQKESDGSTMFPKFKQAEVNFQPEIQRLEDEIVKLKAGMETEAEDLDLKSSGKKSTVCYDILYICHTNLLMA